MRRLLVAALLTACAPSAAQAPIDEQWRDIVLEVSSAELGAAHAGGLRFRGGLELRAEGAALGGLSGLEVLDGDRIVAITDAGGWFTARLLLNDAGDLIGLEAPRIALMRDESGAPFETKRAGDSEGLTQLPDGRFAVSFEQTQTIRIYDLDRDGPFGAASPGPRLAEAHRLAPNQGLEALTALGNGDLLVGAENGRGGAPLWRAPLDAREEAPRAAVYPLRDGFALVGFDRLPNGEIIALERAFMPVLGARSRLTRFSESALDDPNFTPEVIATMNRPLRLDNFEAIAATQRADGGVRIYILSDDNFSAQQRTLLYAFDLEAPAQ